MNPATIIERVKADGITLTVTPTGTIKVSGASAVISRWLPIIREHKSGLLAVLQHAANEIFSFSPPGDPANDDEALQERVAIMMEGNGWDEATALQEARWQADRERCWRAFLRNAQRVLEAPAHGRAVLLAQYQIEAIGRFGESAGMNMACGLRAWVKERAVH